MNAPARNRFFAWLKDLECRMDAWAGKRMTPEEYAEARVLDQRLKANFWPWLAKFAVIVVFVGLILLSIWPQLGLARAFGFSALGCTYVMFAFVSAWYGYRKYTRRPAWKVLALFVALVLGGAVTGFMVANFNMGRPLADIRPEKVARALAVALAIGLALVAILMGIAHMRLREATQKSARLQAEADGERLARQGTQAELKLLQAQVEPHFLFNTLSNLRYLVQTGSAEALPMLDHLIHYLRTSLPEMRAEGSTLGREGELARAYLGILRLRMGGALDIAIDIPAGLAGAAFPPLMVMTLVENAIKHGVAPMGRGRIAVRAFEERDHIVVQVEDDGRGLAEPIGQGVGLANIRERLRALHGDGAELELSGREPAGTLASIRVPAR
jgi:signal transduction histidine kinase